MLSSIFFRIRYLHISRKTKLKFLLLNFKRLEDSYLEKAGEIFQEVISNKSSCRYKASNIRHLIKLTVLPIEIVLNEIASGYFSRIVQKR